MCLKEIGLHAKNYANYCTRRITQHDWRGGLYDHLMSTRVFILMMIKQAPQITRQMAMDTISELLITSL